MAMAMAPKKKELQNVPSTKFGESCGHFEYLSSKNMPQADATMAATVSWKT